MIAVTWRLEVLVWSRDLGGHLARAVPRFSFCLLVGPSFFQPLSVLARCLLAKSGYRPRGTSTQPSTGRHQVNRRCHAVIHLDIWPTWIYYHWQSAHGPKTPRSLNAHLLSCLRLWPAPDFWRSHLVLPEGSLVLYLLPCFKMIPFWFLSVI